MTETLVALRNVLEVSFAPSASESPETVLDRVDAELGACFTRLFVEHDSKSIPWDSLHAIADEFRDRSRMLPEPEQRDHFDWWILKTGSYKPVMGNDGRLRAPDLPKGRLSVPLALVVRVYERIRALRYDVHRRESPGPCDCAALVFSGVPRGPSSPELRDLGPSDDGYYQGHLFECGLCKTQWLHAWMDDDSNSMFWQPLTPSAGSR